MLIKKKLKGQICVENFMLILEWLIARECFTDMPFQSSNLCTRALYLKKIKKRTTSTLKIPQFFETFWVDQAYAETIAYGNVYNPQFETSYNM